MIKETTEAFDCLNSQLNSIYKLWVRHVTHCAT